jgi:signal transduction histidine kinase
MFRRLRFTIALQFTLIVFILLLLQGLLFIPINYSQYLYELDENIAQDAQRIILLMEEPTALSADQFPDRDLVRTRVFDTKGNRAYVGDVFLAQEDTLNMEPWSLRYLNDNYRVLTFPLTNSKGELVGYLQVAEVYHILADDLWEDVWETLLESSIFAVLTFSIGLLFSRISLRPAVEMYRRLNAFAQDASHELKTPLALANSALDLAHKSHEYEEGIQEAKTHIARAADLVERLLLLAKISKHTLVKQLCDVGETTTTVVQDLQPLAKKKHITITVESLEGEFVQADRALFRQLLSNIIENAIKFSEPKGPIRIVIEPGTLTVEDRGAGIDQQMHERIFDPFFQQDPSRATEGHGIGLSIVKKIADAHGWKLYVQSIPNVGTSLTVAFG